MNEILRRIRFLFHRAEYERDLEEEMRHHLAHSEIRREFFSEPFPTATVVGVTSLAHEDWLIEIEAAAYLGD